MLKKTSADIGISRGQMIASSDHIAKQNHLLPLASVNQNLMSLHVWRGTTSQSQCWNRNFRANPMRSSNHKLRLTPSAIARLLVITVGLLLIANLFSIYCKFVLGTSPSFFRTFYFNAEGNVPTLYSFLTILMTAVLLWMTGSLQHVRNLGQSYFWKFLSVIFVFIAVDELISFHETLTDNGRAMLGKYGTGFLHFSWVVPYTLTFAFIGLFFIRHFLRLPLKTKTYFLAGGTLFITGAVGFEMLGGHYIATRGDQALTTDVGYALLTTAEELLEMIGIIVFIYGLLQYHLLHAGRPKVKFSISLSAKARTVQTALNTNAQPEISQQ